jgi:ribonuclease HI
MDLVRIYADESCLGNQFTDRDSPGGAGGLMELWREAEPGSEAEAGRAGGAASGAASGGAAGAGPPGYWLRRDYWSSEPGSTNNRMALVGAADLLTALRRPCRVIFTSDSQYLVTGMREWIHGWAARGWKRKAGPIENVELWRALALAAQRHEVEWRWVRGHAGHPQNEYVNFLAIRAAKELSASGGLVDSKFVEWLEQQREKRQQFMDFIEVAPPPEDDEFAAARRPPG